MTRPTKTPALAATEVPAQFQAGQTLQVGRFIAVIVETRRGFKNGKIEMRVKLPDGRFLWQHRPG